LQEANPILLLEKIQIFCDRILRRITKEQEDYAYAEGKWTIKELLQHILDTEQILSYRALRFARKDQEQALPFDENIYVNVLNNEDLNWEHQLEAQRLLRQYTIHFFKGLTIEQCQAKGSEAFAATPQATAAIIAGHQLHHIYVLQERYLGQEVEYFEL
jgi:uncharacterized damage-inducible protein DinB